VWIYLSKLNPIYRYINIPVYLFTSKITCIIVFFQISYINTGIYPDQLEVSIIFSPNFIYWYRYINITVYSARYLCTVDLTSGSLLHLSKNWMRFGTATSYISLPSAVKLRPHYSHQNRSLDFIVYKSTALFRATNIFQKDLSCIVGYG
jgi:hypothetical protein